MGWQDKIAAQGANTGGSRMQYGALCWRSGADGVEVLLITSRDTGRWVIPKGWPMPGLSPEAAAAQEAWEEAGVQGTMNPLCVGRYGYQKCLPAGASVPCAVAVYGLRVEDMAKTFPEVKERRRKWFSRAEAATLVAEPELATIIAQFLPPLQGRPGPIAADDDDDIAGSVESPKDGKRKGH
ncbi:MAG: NUDIX hydrolase [Tabrizicola sp.]|uniref:NUDIX hydrolase n=1 Tax=Tabrizicola sp. TaxID=2005166 RepID=UPI002ABC1558|nr:NUDIX hydrolase [Tabrizicola sp.]MDZ4089380.1 NUDIX hydrolase [Tabrizicola sp.]